MRERKDRKGNIIEPGVRVAFNYSGDVATGIVEKLTPSEIHIRRDSDWHGNNPISKVKRDMSVCVIFEDDYVKLLDSAVNKAVAAQTKMLHDQREKLEQSRIESDEFLDQAKKNFADIINVVRKAWDLDEIKLYVEEKFGSQVLEEEEEVPEWLQEFR